VEGGHGCVAMVSGGFWGCCGWPAIVVIGHLFEPRKSATAPLFQPQISKKRPRAGGVTAGTPL
jgi:hypothetical protein